jgi:hypothetical protein
MSKTTTLMKVTAAAVPVLLIGAYSLATLSSNASLDSTLHADGVFQVNLDGQAGSVTAPFDVTSLKPGETATKTVQLENVGDAPAYTYLSHATVTGDAAFGAALNGTVEGDGVTSSAPLTSLTSLTATSPAWVINPGESLPVTITVRSATGSDAVIEGDVGISFGFDSSSADPMTRVAISYSRTRSWSYNQPAVFDRWSVPLNMPGSGTTHVLPLLDIAGPGLDYTPAQIIASSAPYSVTLATDVATIPGLRASTGGIYLWNLPDTTPGQYVLNYTVNTLDGVGGAVLSSTPVSVTYTITD